MRKYVIRGVNVVSADAEYSLHIEFLVQGEEQAMLQIIDNRNENIRGQGVDDFTAFTKRLIKFLAIASNIDIYKNRLDVTLINIPDGYFCLKFIIAFDESRKGVRSIYNNIYNKWEYDQPIERKAFIEFLEQFMAAVLSDEALNDRDA